jgi:hypothetical protein
VVCGICLTGDPVLFGGSFDKHDWILTEERFAEKIKIHIYSFSGTTKPPENISF